MRTSPSGLTTAEVGKTSSSSPATKNFTTSDCNSTPLRTLNFLATLAVTFISCASDAPRGRLTGAAAGAVVSVAAPTLPGDGGTEREATRVAAGGVAAITGEAGGGTAAAPKAGETGVVAPRALVAAAKHGRFFCRFSALPVEYI